MLNCAKLVNLQRTSSISPYILSKKFKLDHFSYLCKAMGTFTWNHRTHVHWNKNFGALITSFIPLVKLSRSLLIAEHLLHTTCRAAMDRKTFQISVVVFTQGARFMQCTQNGFSWSYMSETSRPIWVYRIILWETIMITKKAAWRERWSSWCWELIGWT